MNALAHRLPYQPARPRLELVPSLDLSELPTLPGRTLPGRGCPRADRPSSAVFKRRRIVAAVAATVLVLLLGPAVNGGVSWAWHNVLGATSAPTMIPAASVSEAPPVATWTVGPRDTLWGIAQAVAPRGDFRSVLDRLIERYGDSPLEIGATISVAP